ncbi:MAG: MerR family transcriptional regulator [Myxococcota bacterium]
MKALNTEHLSMETLVNIPEGRAFRIGDLAKRAQRSTRAVRLYEGMGLLGPALRTEGGHRLYDHNALTRLGWIDRLQTLGLSLTDIRSFLGDLESSRRGPEAMDQARRMFESKLGEVRGQIEALRALESELQDGLTYLATCTDCAADTDYSECKTCDRPHEIEAPVLITGMHHSGEGTTR